MASETTGHIKDTTDYSNCKNEIYDEIDKLVNRADRFQSIDEREEKSVFDVDLIRKVSKGKYATRWRGLSMMKDCLDMVIYEQLLWEVRPRNVFETGAYTGACALWMSDVMKIYDSPCHIHTIDIDLSLVDPLVKKYADISVKLGDATQIEKAFPSDLLEKCAHPWVVSEDCHVDVQGVMEYFHKHMETGDYFIIEDTSPDTPLVSGQGLLDTEYEKWGKKKLTLMKEFLRKYPGYYAVDTFYTDYYGYNGTFNWDGYLKRIKD